MKRNNYLSWEEFFISIALITAQRSKDPSTQVGCCIVNNNVIIGTGYNGMPNGCNDDEMPWTQHGGFIEAKYAYVVHAEVNAITNADSRQLIGATLYCTLAPCNECAKVIIQSGIKEVVFVNGFRSTDYHIVAQHLFEKAGILVRKTTADIEKIKNVLINVAEEV